MAVADHDRGRAPAEIAERDQVTRFELVPGPTNDRKHRMGVDDRVPEARKVLQASGDPTGLKRLWLHQANINMNDMIGRKVLGREPTPDENVIILDEYANTSSAGSIIAFHLHNEGFAAGETGLICSFGAGYSAGTVFVRKR